MKKILTFLMAIIMVISLFACDMGTDEGDCKTYKGTLFDTDVTIKVSGETVTLTNTMVDEEEGVKTKMVMSLLGGKATVSGNTVTADFTGDITYELAISFSGEGAEQYKAAVKEYFLSELSSETDKKLISDVFDGKTVKFGKSSALSYLAEGFNYVVADVNGTTALYTEARYESGEKVTFEYYESSALKKVTYYNTDGTVNYFDEYEDEKPNDSLNGEYSDNNAENNTNNEAQRPSNNNPQGNNQQSKPTDSNSTTTKPDKDESSSTDNDNSSTDEDECVTSPDPDMGGNSGNTVMGGGGLSGVIIGGNGAGTVGGETVSGGIDLSDGVMFYISGTFLGKYSGMDAVLVLPPTKMPEFTVNVEMQEGDTTIKQTILVKGGELIYSNSVLVIVNFDVPDVKYYMTIQLEGSGAQAYKQQLINDLNTSGMSKTDIQLYKDALDGIEISFGKESSIYQGIKLPAIKFKLDINNISFESEKFDLDQSTNNSVIVGGSSVQDQMTHIGGTATKDPNSNSSDKSNFDNETSEM